jgi:hypothetical protein
MALRAHTRPRRNIPWRILRLLQPLFRYSNSREAYVLRLIGNRWGPVLIFKHHDGPLGH